MTVTDDSRVAPPQTATPSDTDRAVRLHDMHMLLHLLATHPELPLPPFFQLSVPLSADMSDEAARNVVGTVAEQFGKEPLTPPGQFGVEIRVGTAVYWMFAVSPAERARFEAVRRLGVEALAAQTAAATASMADTAPAESGDATSDDGEDAAPVVPIAKSARQGRTQAAAKRRGGDS